MSMFTLQTLGLILLFGLIGVLFGWLVRTFFCKPGAGGNANTLSGTGKAGSTTYTKTGAGETTSGNLNPSAGSHTTSSEGGINKTATVAAGAAAVAATAAAVASNRSDTSSEPSLNTDDMVTIADTPVTTETVVKSANQETPNATPSVAAVGAAGAAAVAAASAGGGTQQDDVRQLRGEAETLLNDNFSAHSQPTNHLIIGAGPAGVVAAETIRKLDASANITLIGDEPEAPYSRMAIPYFLEENIQAEGTHLRKSDNHYEAAGIQVLSGRVKRVDTENKQVETANGLTLPYDKLLIATGSHPLTPPIPGLDNPKVGNCWDLADSRKIIENVKPGSSVVQIGAGFIGCIILEALVKRGAKLTVVEMDNRMVPRMLDEQCGGMLKSWCEDKGVSVLTDTQVKSIENNGDRIKVNLSQGEAIDADFVISATGVASNTDFLEGSGINIDQGVLVNHHLETNIPDVYAAGDVAQGIDFTTGGYSVHAIQPTAADHGTISAKNMVKGNKTRHKGSLQMNILSTLDLVSTSYGAWEGVEGGEHSELVDKDSYRYIRLQFKDDKLVGANTLGITQNIGALRGLIQNQSKLGEWKQRLMDNPLHFMDAYVSITGNHG